MAKIYGLFGAMTGKVADAVMVVRNGEQIVRKYQPIVSNPSTPSQIATRAKLKMMSQLSAVLAPVIAIPKQGAVSSRNLFTKLNYQTASYSNDTAQISLTNVKITDSAVGLPAVTYSVVESVPTASISLDVSEDFDKVVYVVVLKNDDGSLRIRETHVCEIAGDDGKFTQQFDYRGASVDGVVYAYGIRLNNENARVIFGNLQSLAAETIAKLIVQRTLLNSDVTLSETRAVLTTDVSQAVSTTERKVSKK